jgi:hypothetical protein
MKTTSVQSFVRLGQVLPRVGGDAARDVSVRVVSYLDRHGGWWAPEQGGSHGIVLVRAGDVPAAQRRSPDAGFVFR